MISCKARFIAVIKAKLGHGFARLRQSPLPFRKAIRFASAKAGAVGRGDVVAVMWGASSGRYME